MAGTEIRRRGGQAPISWNRWDRDRRPFYEDLAEAHALTPDEQAIGARNEEHRYQWHKEIRGDLSHLQKAVYIERIDWPVYRLTENGLRWLEEGEGRDESARLLDEPKRAEPAKGRRQQGEILS